MSVHIAAVRAGLELPAHLARQVWRGNELGHAPRGSVPSGHPLLDAQLPDGGWQRTALHILCIYTVFCLRGRMENFGGGADAKRYRYDRGGFKAPMRLL